MTEQPSEPEHQLLGAIPVGSPAHKQLAGALRKLREQAPDEETARLYDDVLAGRRSGRDLVDSDGFAQAASTGIQQYQEHVSELDDEERAQLAQHAEAEQRRLDRPSQG